MALLTVRQRRALRTAVLGELSRTELQVASLQRSLDDIVDAAAMSNLDDEHDPEGSTIAFERAQVTALLAQARADRGALVAMLGRIDDHDDGFGACATCGEPIGVERMMALPTTVRCVRCAASGPFT